MEIEFQELNEFETAILDSIYDKCEKAFTEVAYDPSLDDIFLVTKTITMVCGMLESIRVSQKKVKGYTKKKVAYHLGKKLISIHCSQNLQKIYEKSGHDVIEIIISFAKVHKVFSKCHVFSCNFG
ncbi:MAG: hypothetical protein CMB64_03450 [Euryarchaeota archaeon]|nr:hypothetical protein [Euryarchaeota archaeon]